MPIKLENRPAISEMKIGPNDALMSGYSFEQATTVLGIFEKGARSDKWFSTEMLCTLDNFIKVVLFSDHIYLAPLTGDNGCPRLPRCLTDKSSQEILKHEGLFDMVPVGSDQAEAEQTKDIIERTLKPVSMTADSHFIISAQFPDETLIKQELLVSDIVAIELGIKSLGLHVFKPVFPGEHLYLGLRQSRVSSPLASHTFTDAMSRRIRLAFRQRMLKLNKVVPVGGFAFPLTPPIFLMRVLCDLTDGRNIVDRILELRKERAMGRFRKWTANCMLDAGSRDLKKREAAVEAYEKIEKYEFPPRIKASDWVETVKKFFKVFKRTSELDVGGVIEEVAPPLQSLLNDLPLRSMIQFSGNSGYQPELDSFLQRHFEDKFTDAEMESISPLLSLPDNVVAWKELGAKFDATPGRLLWDKPLPKLARPYKLWTKDSISVKKAEDERNRAKEVKMSDINVTDRVQIIQAPPGQSDLLNKTGKVIMITDNTNCFVVLDNGQAVTVDIKQLKEIG